MFIIKRFYAVIIASAFTLLMIFLTQAGVSVDTSAESASDIGENISTEQATEDVILDVSFEKNESIKPSEEVSLETDNSETESVPEETIPTEPEKPVELPDIITVDVKLYNEYSENFNPEDGMKYLNDIKFYLEKYAPDGMYLSAASAMSYTEGGSGKKGVYRTTNNCFGIRATPQWDGYVFARSTCKVYKDYATAMKYGASDLFRAYDSMEDSVKDYVALISGDYYCGALQTESPKEYLRYILNKGYGEDHLLGMWLGVIDIYDLYEFDK